MPVIENIVGDLLAHQNPREKHSLLTRVVVSAVIVFANLVLYLFYGLMGAVVFYLIGVEALKLSAKVALIPLGVAVLGGLRKSLSLLVDYWRNYGHG